MTTDQVLAKVRAAADKLANPSRVHCVDCRGRGGVLGMDRTPCPFCDGTGRREVFPSPDDAVCARAALAMVEQCEDLIALANAADDANRDNFAAGRPVTAAINGGESSAYRTTASRILAALRTAVGE